MINRLWIIEQKERKRITIDVNNRLLEKNLSILVIVTIVVYVVNILLRSFI
jgi:uncharacterized protein HemY